MNSNHFSCFIHNSPCCRVRYSEDPLVRPNSFAINIFLETAGDLLRSKDNLPFLTTFGASEGQLPVFDITWGSLEDFANPRSAPSHQSKHQPVSGFDGSKDDFNHHFLFENGPTDESRGSTELFQHGGIAWASEIGIEILTDKIEERGQLGAPSPFGCLLGVLIDLSDEGENFFRG